MTPSSSEFDDNSNDNFDDNFDDTRLRPLQEPLTPEEKERLLARARKEGRTLTSEERYAIFGPPPESSAPAPDYGPVTEMEAAPIEPERLATLKQDFFHELGAAAPPPPPLVRGIIFDFDDTLATLSRPLDALMMEGARAAEAYMRSVGMALPENFAEKIVEARRFAEEKSAEEQEEHLADDAMSFLLQFFGYPASRMDPQVLRRAVDIFYAPEMTAWRLRPNVHETLEALQAAGYKLALLTNYNCDRVFQRSVDYLGLRRYFDLCLSSASVEYRKPDPTFFQIVLDRWECLAYEVVVVGDSLQEDIRGGIELGALTVLVRGATRPQVIHDNTRLAHEITPDAVIDDLSALPELIRAWT
ncbi:HAD family hydrolase [Caldilinea sp.]|jgi:putative hydrolase of the HAD superfamily|uniref:HAD family hydrolase n=1 Tax=Caldilinea sp. TaxID=2293560 RepID=UPI001B1EA5B3|nr:HAD family hydrolase [Caldilinea sp.]MBO9393967.1 HAD family hydrolase [Caldilinea sp.]